MEPMEISRPSGNANKSVAAKMVQFSLNDINKSRVTWVKPMIEIPTLQSIVVPYFAEYLPSFPDFTTKTCLFAR